MKSTFKQNNLIETPNMAIRCRTNIRDISPKGRPNSTAQAFQTQITTASKETNRTKIVTKLTKKKAVRAAARSTTTTAASGNANTAIKII